MGMYTEIYVNCAFKHDTPPKVIEVLQYLFGEENLDRPDNLPDHELFKTEGWYLIGSGSSCYHIPFATSKFVYDKYMKQWYLTSRSDLKNYNDEIEKFFDWINPYVSAHDGTFIGYSRYEEDLDPKLYYKWDEEEEV